MRRKLARKATEPIQGRDAARRPATGVDQAGGDTARLDLADPTLFDVSLLARDVSSRHGSVPSLSATLLRLQRTEGNRAVQRLIQGATRPSPVSSRRPGERSDRLPEQPTVPGTLDDPKVGSAPRVSRHADGPVGRRHPAAGPVIQRVKQNLAAPANNQTATVRATLAAMRAQVSEYAGGYPPEITNVDGRSMNDVDNLVAACEGAFNAIVAVLNPADATPFTRAHHGIGAGHALLPHFTTLTNNFNVARTALNDRRAAWHDWQQNNPDTRANLQDLCTARELGLKVGGDIQFGQYNFLVYKSVAALVPVRASGDESQAFYKRQTQLEQVGDLRTNVDQLNMNQPVAIAQDSDLMTSKSQGAVKMRQLLLAGGPLICSRVMSAKELERTRGAGGRLVPKLSAAKWFTIGQSANINSSGDTAHSQGVQWTINGNFRKVLTMPGMHNYNENAQSARGYEEPYWVWKDVEVGNIALSPVLTAAFNDMITETRINGVVLQ